MCASSLNTELAVIIILNSKQFVERVRQFDLELKPTAQWTHKASPEMSNTLEMRHVFRSRSGTLKPRILKDKSERKLL